MPLQRKQGEGWIDFAGFVFALLAAFNLIYGIGALVDADVFVENAYLFGTLTLWGIIHVCVGGIQLAVAGLIFNRMMLGAALGAILAFLGAIAALLSVHAEPIWSVTIIVVSVLVIYALTAYSYLFK